MLFGETIPVVIYMHGNASARVEVLPQLSHLLSMGISVFSFDFAGSGKSDGDYVSLGYFEQEDLSCVVKHLRSLDISPNVRISKIAAWGRSMGAATCEFQFNTSSNNVYNRVSPSKSMTRTNIRTYISSFVVLLYTSHKNNSFNVWRFHGRSGSCMYDIRFGVLRFSPGCRRIS